MHVMVRAGVVAAALLAAHPVAAQNKVEPLSNGLRLHWTKGDILKQFGEPTKRTWDNDTFGYPGFDLVVGGRDKTIWSVTLKSPDVRLASGIAVGSTAAAVRRVFDLPTEIRHDQYRLAITYDGGVVTAIRISPIGDQFRPAGSPKPSEGTDRAPARRDGALTATAVVGQWYGAAMGGPSGGASAGTPLLLMSDGRYRYGSGGSGRWRIEGDSVRFSGTLSAWNRGLAGLSDGNLEFSWTTASGGKQSFVFIREP